MPFSHAIPLFMFMLISVIISFSTVAFFCQILKDLNIIFMFILISVIISFSTVAFFCQILKDLNIIRTAIFSCYINE